ncbi:GlxA family transcriptional regulator [Brucella haematophila]|uniref:GlxA family transcriptional regulator n=1 Tax=Brucella haematophila TaxID=419474 RepID=UPI00110F0028|nr:GlxA family transcriptional regulator [Brucella haematophila]TMV00718.1 GlxA family transcriptional regulator [Brucella haematophila]
MIFEPSDEQLSVTLLVLPDCSLMSLAATLDPMRGANRVTGRSLYSWRVVSPDGSDPITSSGLKVGVNGKFEATPQDILIIVSAFHALEHATPKLLGQLRQAAKQSQLVIGVEAGSWVLAKAGLLNGRKATTHWEDLEAFSQRFPDVEMQSDRWVRDGTFLTTGGAAPALDMMLALIRARHGYSIALDVASLYVYDEVRQASDAQPLVSLGRLLNREPRLADAIKIMENHIDRPIPVTRIARRLGLSTRSLEMLFANVIGQSPGNYYLSLRLKAARRLILDTHLSMADTAEQTGFSSISSLSRAFKRHFGQAPSKLRQK